MARKSRFLLIFIALIFILSSCTGQKRGQDIGLDQKQARLDEDKAYYSKDDVAEYLMTYAKLPPNYLTKSEAKQLGWIAKEGNLWDVTDKGVIGGDVFGNREGLLPHAQGRIYYEADVDYQGGHRNAHRLVFSNDGLIFYTSDHYSSFEEIRGEQ